MQLVSSLFVAVGEVELHLPGALSLKDKRQDVRSLVERLRHRFSVLIIESDHQELHQRAGLALVSLATDAEAARGTVAKVIDVIHEIFTGVVLGENITISQVR